MKRLAVAVVVLLACGVWVSVAQAAPKLSITSFSAGGSNADGSPSTQAGAHPFELVTAFQFGTVFDERVGLTVPATAVKDTVFELPPGVLGDPTAVPQCRQEDMTLPKLGSCPIDTEIGVAEVDLAFLLGRQLSTVPVYNMVPPPGEPAQFAFLVIASVSHIDIKVRSDSDYGATATVHNLNTLVPVYGATVHLWGVPGDPAHDPTRGGPSHETRKPLLRNPTSCTGPLSTAFHATSYEEPDQVVSATAPAPAVTGCDHVPFAPSLTLTPESKRAGSPSGFGVDLDLPQNENPDGLATADLRRAVVSLPSGVAINPSAADGLDGCSDAEFGLHSTAPDTCPDAAVVGTMKVTTPLLAKPLVGSIYLADPHEQGPAAAAAGDMFRVFLEAHGSGVEVKLAGSVVPDPQTGQLVATFDDNPQVPFSNVHLEFLGGPRAALSLPKACGTYTTHSEFTSWASDVPVSSERSFTIDQGCDQAGRFEPSLSAGLTSPVAGRFSPFTLTLSRPDGQQDLSSLDLVLAPGLVGKIGGVPLCPEPQAAAGTCSSTSQIGRVAIGAGAGTSPLWLPQAGKTPTAVFLAGPYRGAPFSLSVVVPAQAGPFDLGTVVVRAALFIDPHDAHVTVKSDPIPTILDGVPLNLQKVNVVVDRPGFMVAPTNCNALQSTATVGSAAGGVAVVASRFQVDGCGSLGFAPKFTANVAGVVNRTAGKTASVVGSLANGVSLHVKLAFPDGSFGTEANVARVKVALPKQLPSRLTTLQKACTNSQFVANPAGCPSESLVGTAKVLTPLLPVALTGPAYFVSHGGEAFPSLTLVLQGDGVTVELVGTTFISAAGITSTTFSGVPDVPFSLFELTFPQGKFSAVTGNGDLCKSKLVMPTDYVAQNGASLHQSNIVGVTGCAKVTRAQRLAAALRACKKQPKRKRAACRRTAARKY